MLSCVTPTRSTRNGRKRTAWTDEINILIERVASQTINWVEFDILVEKFIKTSIQLRKL